MLDTFTQSLEQYLRQGKLEPSYHVILQLAQRDDLTTDSVATVVVQCLDRLLDEFVIEPTLRFCREMDTRLPGEVVETINEEIGRRVSIIVDWAGKVNLIGRERRTREIRAAVRGRNLGEAEQYVAELLGSTPDRAIVQYVGSILGSIEHGQREAEQLLARLRKTGGRMGLTGESVDLMEQARQERVRASERGRSEFREAEFVRDLNFLTVELKGWLPNTLVTDPPTDEQIARFYEALHAVVASVFLGGDRGRWADVTLVLAEYCPREISVVGQRSGVEERAYMTLTPTGRRTVFEAFARLGRNEAVTQSYLEFAGSVRDERLTRYMAEVMGAMRSPQFLSWLRKTFGSDDRPSVRGTIMLALSNYADGKSAEHLLKALGSAVHQGKRRGIIPEGPERREVVQAMFALGRIVRSPRMDPGGRNEIFKRAITLVPEKDARLLHELAFQCFRSPSEGWNPPLREWAIKVLTRSLWLGDMTPDFAVGDEQPGGVLGWRAPTVQALAAIGRDALPTILETCEESGLRYGGAYVGLAEALGQIGDPRGLDLLERLLANALLHEGSGRTKYQAEKYYDATEGVRKELTPDEVIAALLYGVERIRDERTDVILVRVHTQIHAPGVRSPGSETDEVLNRIHARLTREGRWNELVLQSMQRRSEGDEKRDAATLKREAAEAIQALRARGFFKSKQRPRKIAAIQTLAGQCNLEALPLIVAQLADSDALVRGAAETALGEYAMAATNETVARALVYALLEALGNRNDSAREATRNILKRLGPGREPLRSKLVALSQHETDPLVRAEASRLLLEAKEEDVLTRLAGSGEAVEGGMDEGAGESESEAKQREASHNYEQVMQAKREYLRARQEWIRGGKRGDPPIPPPEIK